MAFHLQHDWFPVLGHTVEIRHWNSTVRAGRVDAVTQDGSILWLAAEGHQPRRLFERAQGYQVWIQYAWETQPR
ncbi:MAG TPA: hypothetical protein VJ617_20180 [Arthrobacter sp.]|nr:hypothetical protein [Arthrobacter sp.]